MLTATEVKNLDMLSYSMIHSSAADHQIHKYKAIFLKQHEKLSYNINIENM